MATYTVGTTVATFGALIEHDDTAGAIRTLSLGVHFNTAADWDTLRSLINWDMQVIPMPWGNTVEVLVKGGPGSGTLVIAGLSLVNFTAYLSEASRMQVFRGGH